MSDDKRLIKDYLPIEAISKEASWEKSVRKGHIPISVNLIIDFYRGMSLC